MTTRLVALAAVALAACASGTTKSGTTYSFQMSTLKADVGHPLDKVYEASVEVTKEMGFAIENANVDALEGIVVSKGATNHTRRIRLERIGPGMTRIEIYVAPMGNTARSAEILERIESRLGPQPQ